MIKIDKNKPKVIKMDVNVQGIDKTKLRFNFKIELLDITIGFKPELIDDNRLEINLPVLSSKIIDVEPGRYKSCLEINDGEKYFLKPWEGEVIIEEEPIITANIEEDDHLDPTNVSVGFVEDENYKPKAKVENVRENKKTKKKTKPVKKKTMSKEAAVKFVKEARKKFKNESEEVVEKFIKKTLNEYGFEYNPKKKSKNDKPKKQVKIESKNDVLEYLKQSGIRSENTLNSLMEMLDNKTGGDPEAMADMANRMINPQHNQFENNTDAYQYFQGSQSGGMGYNSQSIGMSNNDYGDGQEFNNIDIDGLSVPSFNEGNNNPVESSPVIDNQNFSSSQSQGNSNLMEQIQKAKMDLNKQVNNS